MAVIGWEGGFRSVKSLEGRVSRLSGGTCLGSIDPPHGSSNPITQDGAVFKISVQRLTPDGKAFLKKGADEDDPKSYPALYTWRRQSQYRATMRQRIEEAGYDSLDVSALERLR